MSKTAQEKAEGAKNARLKRFFHITLEEYKKVEAYEAATMPSLLGTTRRALDNRALGMIETSFKEKTPDILRHLAQYLEHYPVNMVLGRRYGIIGKAKKKKVMIYGSEKGPIKPEKRK